MALTTNVTRRIGSRNGYVRIFVPKSLQAKRTLTDHELQTAVKEHYAALDLTEMLTIGGKYGIRLGETRLRSGGNWEGAKAQLAVIRADVHVVRNWDVLREGRSLWETNGETAELGALAAIYRHIGENFDVGIGSNFGSFCDDLSDLTKDDQGFFVNAVGKF